ncbi:hypothetical protein WA026_022741 [Henosepilachna vigintioctopunctata]|uniref:Probable ATP-dependent RNA helicase spindle-E n=1 Tax=Henosepilachna vigintioctopunctata TaxID=420089 RepID=A0AAW1USA9_9CUCU
MAEIEVPIFLHPHLFWIFEKKNNLTRHEIGLELAKKYESCNYNEEKFDVGEVVAVRSNATWCRAIIEDICDGKNRYEVWLMDYGHLFMTNSVYKLDKQLKKKPALVRQASLYNVVFIDEAFSLEESCITISKKSVPNAGATANALQFLKDYTLFFIKDKEVNGILFGDILYKKNLKKSFLTKTLIDKNLMVEDKELFLKVEQSRIFDKDFHIQALRQRSKMHRKDGYNLDLTVLFGEIFTRSTARGISLSGYSESENESENTNTLSKTNEFMKKLHRKLEARRHHTESCTEEEIELDDKSEPICILEQSKGCTRSAQLKNILNRKKKLLQKDSSISDSEIKLNPALADLSSSSSIQSTKISSRLSALKQKCAKRQSNIDSSLFSDVESVTSSETTGTAGKNSLSSVIAESKKAKVHMRSQKSTTNVTNVTYSEKKIISKSNIDAPAQLSSEKSDVEWCEKHKKQENEGSQMVIKPFCDCSDCKHWSTSDDWSQRENFKGECKIKEVKTERPGGLLIKRQREGTIKLSSINYRAMTKLDKSASYKLLVHAIFLPAPIEHLSEAPFNSIVHRSMKNLGYKSARKIQTYIWPAIVRGYNVCYVHRKKTGKTLAYLSPICSFLLDKEMRYSDLKKGGPIVLILASNSAQCEEIYDLASRLFDGSGSRRPKVLLVSYPFTHINMSSVDMLITIPSVFLELLKKNATNLKRLCHFVLEDADILLDKFRNEIKSTVDVVESMLSHRHTTHTVQMIMSAEHWSLKVENFVKKLTDIPLVCIGDYFEAAIYGGVTLKLKFLESKAKRDAVVDILSNKWKYLKSIVFCNSDDEIKLLKVSLELSSITCIAITSDLSVEDILQQEANWELTSGEDNKVLICTDQMLHTNLSITSVVLIIHYSLPEKWTSFIKRFSCLLENCKTPLISNDDKLSCETYILTDELCQNQIPKLMSLLKTYNVPMKEYEELSNGILRQQEESKVAGHVPICVNLKQFGYCHVDKCLNRHIFDCDLDTKSLLPKNGCVKFKILELGDVNHLKVNIIQHTDIKGNKTEFRDKNNINDQKLTSHLCGEKTKAEAVVKGVSYAFWDTEEFDDMFRECLVEEVSDDNVNILVKENGRRMLVSKSKIFELPEELKKNSEGDLSSVEIIIANLKPPYKDVNFSARAFLKLQRTIEDLKYDDNVFVGNICLQLGNTIWVDDITEEVDVFEKNIIKTDVTKKIMAEKLAERNADHMTTLYTLCKDAGIKLPNYNSVLCKKATIVEAPQVAPQWAFLEVENCNQVVFSCAVSPEDFYVRLEKFLVLLVNLEKDIDEIVKRQGSKRNFTVIPGNYYLAFDSEENKFYRALVKQVENGEALCFSVDYGDENVVKLEDIRFLPNHLITKLPFQAIHCKLHGLKAIDGEWPAEAIDVFYEKYSFYNDSNVFKTLYAKCMYYEKGNFRGQSRFSILLKDASIEKPIILNQLLLDCGWADMIANVHFNDFDIPMKNPISDDENSPLEQESDGVEEAKDILKTTELVESNEVGYGNSINYKNDSELVCYFGNSDEEDDQFMAFMNELMNSVKATSEDVSTVKSTLPAIEAAPFEVDYNTPDVYWSQTKDSIQLVIKLPNVQTYKLTVVKSRMLNFL